MKNNNNTVWIVLGLVIVALVLFFAFRNKSGQSDQSATDNDSAVVEPSEDLSDGSVNVGAPAASLSYAQALVKYKDARIQLDEMCQATPNRATYKNGATIMIDNRSHLGRTLKIGGPLTIKPWSFKLVKLSTPTVPATWLIDCDTRQNVGTILIQK